MPNNSISQRLLSAAKRIADEAGTSYGGDADKSLAAFTQLAQEVGRTITAHEKNIDAYEFERNKYIAHYAYNMKRESLWLELDRLYWTDRDGENNGRIIDLRSQLGLGE